MKPNKRRLRKPVSCPIPNLDFDREYIDYELNGKVYVAEVSFSAEIHSFYDIPAKTYGLPENCCEAEYDLDYSIIDLTLTDMTPEDNERLMSLEQAREHIEKSKYFEELIDEHCRSQEPDGEY